MSLIPGCRDMSRILSESRDSGRLDFLARLHLLICDVCRRVREQFGIIGAGARRASASGSTLSSDAKERLRRALRGS